MDTKTLDSFKECIPVFQGLLDKNRQEIVALLSEKSLTIKEITENFQLSRSAISHHLHVLKSLEIVSSTKVGTEQYYQLHLDDSINRLKKLVVYLENEKTFID